MKFGARPPAGIGWQSRWEVEWYANQSYDKAFSEMKLKQDDRFFFIDFGDMLRDAQKLKCKNPAFEIEQHQYHGTCRD